MNGKSFSRLRLTSFGVPLLVAGSFLSSGCWFKSFEEWDGVSHSQSGGTSSSMGGSDGSGGDVSNGGGSGGGTVDGPFSTEAYATSMTQGAEAITIEVLPLVTGSGIQVVSRADAHPTRPSSLSAEIDLDVENGNVLFKPDARFWGTYPFTVRVRNGDGEEADVDITVEVTPTLLYLTTIEAGWGGFVIDGALDEGLGSSISHAGDFTGDGVEDFILGAPGYSSGRGRAVVIHGAAQEANGLENLESINLTLGDPAEGVTSILGDDVSKGAGVSVSTAGDVNGDGAGDVILGAVEGGAEGRAYILYGTPDGGTERTNPVSLSDSITDGFTVRGTTGTRTGLIVRGGGDINGDGNDDVLVYANPFYGPPTSETRDSIFAIFGSSTTSDNPSSTLDALADLSFRHPNTFNPGSFLSESVAFVGHLYAESDQARAEVMLAEQGNTSARFAVLRGTDTAWPVEAADISPPTNGWLTNNTSGAQGVSVAGAGQFDGEFGDDLAHCNATTCRVVPSTETDAGFSLVGGSSIQLFTGNDAPRVAGGGDINGDGLDDLLFTEDLKSFLLWGNAALPTALLSVDPATTGLEIDTDSNTIEKIAIIGDINGDGFDDFALTNSAQSGDNGRIYVIFGFASEN